MSRFVVAGVVLLSALLGVLAFSAAPAKADLAPPTSNYPSVTQMTNYLDDPLVNGYLRDAIGAQDGPYMSAATAQSIEAAGIAGGDGASIADSYSAARAASGVFPAAWTSTAPEAAEAVAASGALTFGAGLAITLAAYGGYKLYQHFTSSLVQPIGAPEPLQAFFYSGSHFGGAVNSEWVIRATSYSAFCPSGCASQSSAYVTAAATAAAAVGATPRNVDPIYCGAPVGTACVVYITTAAAIGAHFKPDGSLQHVTSTPTTPTGDYGVTLTHPEITGVPLPTVPTAPFKAPCTTCPAPKRYNPPAFWIHVVDPYAPLPSPLLDPGTGHQWRADPETFILPAPLPYETEVQYRTRVLTLGPNVTVGVVTLDAPDPSKGPGEVTQVAPSPGTTVVNDPTTTVTITENPTTAPYPTGDPNAPTGSSAPPGSPMIPGGSGPCTKFPFGVFCWAADFLGTVNATAEAPSFDVSMAPLLAPLGITTTAHYAFNLSFLDTYMSWVRIILSFAMWAGALWWVGTRLLGFDAAGDPGAAIDEAWE